MKTFKKIFEKLKPATKHIDYMEIKELSEIREAAQMRARIAYMELRRADREYKKACDICMKQHQQKQYPRKAA